MRRKASIIVAVIMIVSVLFSSSAFAAVIQPDELNYTAPMPTMRVVGSTATCKVTLRAAGQSIDATLELKQGNTVK